MMRDLTNILYVFYTYVSILTDWRQLSDVAVAAARAKFFSECGVSLDDVGGIVIDEVSFITAAVFGHVDHVLRAMTGNLDVPCGGVPILLCGDNHQK